MTVVKGSEGRSSGLLTREENQLVVGLVGHRCQTLATTVVQVRMVVVLQQVVVVLQQVVVVLQQVVVVQLCDVILKIVGALYFLEYS